MRRTAALVAVPSNDPVLETDSRLGIGGNKPPLGEVLREETAALRERAGELVASASERATVASDDDSEKATLLLGMLRDHAEAIDAARVKAKAPHLEAGRVVDAHFAEIAAPVKRADAELLARVDAWRKRKEAEAAAERQRLAEEAERQRRLAEAAENARVEAERRARQATDDVEREVARRLRVEAELDQRRAEDRAAQFDARAEEAARPVVIRSGYGPKASRRAVRRAEISDLRVAVRYCLRIDQHRIRDAVQEIYDKQVRAGVRELPGADIVEDSITQVRR